MSEQHPDTEPTSDEPIFWKDGKQFIRLYYFMPEKHLLDVIMNDEIKVSLPEYCNDPLEFVPAPRKTPNGKIREHQQGGGFISFSEKFDNTLMWAHYANSHKGVCLRFDFPVEQQGKMNSQGILANKGATPFTTIQSIEHPEQFLETNPSLNRYSAVLIKVAYRKQRPTIYKGIIGGSFCRGSRIERLDLSPVFFTKAREWNYENEWRLMVEPAAAERFHDNAFFVTGLTKFLSGIFLGRNYAERDDTTWKKIIQAKKKNPYLRDIENLHNKIAFDRAAFHETDYKIILPRLIRQVL